MLDGQDGIQLYAGSHISGLLNALGPGKQHVRLIGPSDMTDVPAAFNVRLNGKMAALRSLISLRCALAPLARDHQFVFDQLGWREKFIAGRGKPLCLDQDYKNIYLAYEEFFRQGGYTLIPQRASMPTSSIKNAVIVPGSRVRSKVIPAPVISTIREKLLLNGISTTVLLIEGEPIDVPADVKTVILPRFFNLLIEALRESDLVISADSLSAHLGEFLEKPTFVLNNAPNSYWLPKSAYLTGANATFSELVPFSNWLSSIA